MSAADAGPGRLRLTGTVAAFDEVVGLGEIDSPAGRYPFHCTQLADGSRSVAVGTAVTFGVLAGRGGQWEAAAIRTRR